MAKTIPQLTDATTVNAGDEIVVQQGGITKRATGAELAKGLNAINGMVNIKDFGAVGDGVSNDSAAFLAAMSTGKPVYVPAGTYNLAGGLSVSDTTTSSLTLFGDGQGATIIKGNAGAYFFTATNNTSIEFRDITFDGGRVRDAGGFPYSAAQTVDGSQGALVCFGPSSNNNTRVTIDSCTFENFDHLPIFIHFYNNVRVTGCRFYKTLDPGLVFCSNVIWSHNITEYCADNGVSVSRGCHNVVIDSNVFADCESCGVWVSGFVIPAASLGGGTVKITGSSYNALSEVTLTSSAGWIGASRMGSYITLFNGATEATLKLVSFTNATTATAVCVNSVNASLQNVDVSTWSLSPSSGATNYTITNNIIAGGYFRGIQAVGGGDTGVIANNVIVRSGWIADSEDFTTGSIASGSTSLNVSSAAPFAVNDHIIIKPQSSYRNYFVAKITNIAGTTLTISPAAPVSYIREPIHLAHTPSTVSNPQANDIRVSGETDGVPNDSATSIHITNNVMRDCHGVSILVGDSGGGDVDGVRVHGNSCFVGTSPVGAYPAASRHFVFLNEANAASKLERISITDNYYDGPGRIVLFEQNDGTPRAFVVCANNVYPNGQDFSAINTATSADLTDNFRTSHYDTYGTLSADAITTPLLQSPAWTTATVSGGGAVAVSKGYLSVAGTNPTTQILSFTKAVNTDLIVFSVRNSSTVVGNTLTIVNDITKIRTQSGSNLVLGGGQSALFAFLNSTVVAQIG